MKSCDFSRSFVTFVTPKRGNNARIQVEARCTLTDVQQGASEDFYLVASCKAEDTYGPGALFRDPNYDFCAIFSKKEHHIIRAGVPYENQDSIGDNQGRFEDVLFDIKWAAATVLSTNDKIVKATLAGKVINGRTEIADPTGRYRAEIEFPVKTMNVNDIRTMYQVDTGPILLPDFQVKAERAIERFLLAFVAYKSPGEAYFILQRPIPAVPGQAGGAKVAHYSEIVRIETRNSILALR